MRIGFIVNPVAGMGGKVGLKGSDGVVQKAIEIGAEFVAPQRAVEFLKVLKLKMDSCPFEFLCAPNKMGMEEAESVGLNCQVLPMVLGKKTNAQDTRVAVKLLQKAKVDLIVFVGGDGTARDILDAGKNGEVVPTVGVPSGVKMYSAIFAITPQAAAEIVTSFLLNNAEVADFEVMDADEEAIRRDVFDVKLYGCLKGVSVPALIQGGKEASPQTYTEEESQAAIAKYVVEELPKGATLILGPGTTVERIAKVLGVKKTVLGVDIYSRGKITIDVNERTIMEMVRDWSTTWIILSPIGHQGMLLGRGNQQISPKIVKFVGKKHILVVATLNKLQGLGNSTLRVDSGDAEVDNLLKGEMLVVTGYREGVTVLVQ